MKLIFLYGPPATGKLTVAKEIAKVIKYKIFHNHLTADLVSSIFPFGTDEYSDLTEEVRLKIFEKAAKANIAGLIFTFVYGIETKGGKNEDNFVKKVIQTIEGNGGGVCFVKLTCKLDELHKRLTNDSRNEHNKLVDLDQLKKISQEYDINSTIPFVNSLVIDNTSLDPAEVAQQIIEYYGILTD